MQNIDLFRSLVSNQNGVPVTTSRKIASTFGREHKSILRAIRNIDCSDEFNERNFAPVTYVDDKGEVRTEFNITKDGVTYLIMGFKGEKAAEFKEAYIEAFNWMYELLQKRMENDFLIGDYTRREQASISNGSFHGRGLAQRKKEKPLLANELIELQKRLQITLDLIESKPA